MLEAIKEMLEYESLGYAFVQELKKKFTPQLVKNVNVSSYQEVRVRSNEAVCVILKILKKLGLDITHVEPGHGPGHLTRDRVNGLMALSKEVPEIEPAHVFIGLIAGTLHDFGCLLVRRYAESGRVIRHGEVGAMLFDAIASEIPGLFNKDERVVIATRSRHTLISHHHKK